MEKTFTQNINDIEIFKLAVEGSGEHIVITNEEGIIIYANHAAEVLTGYSKDEMIGIKAGKLWGGLMSKDYYQEMWETIAIYKKTFVGEITNRRKNGEIYYADVRIYPVLDKKGDVKLFVGIERDITKAKEIDRMKTNFMSLASHQLRTPLSAIKWYLEMFFDENPNNITKTQKEFLDNVNVSNERMINLVNSLLNIGRLESGRITIEPVQTDIKELVNSAIKEITQLTTKKHIKLTQKFDDKVSSLNIDPKLTLNIILNLLSNAAKYTKENGEISISVSSSKEFVVFQIKDSGMGIPKNEQKSIFTKFYRASNVSKTDTTGTGLGLYLAKEIINAFGGDIWFESVENVGTTFWFTIPKNGVKRKTGTGTLENTKNY